MAVAIALVLAVLAAQYGLNHHHQMDVATTERMRPREEYLHQEMTRLLQEIEQYPEEGTVLAALQQWPIWITAGAVAILVLLAEVCFLARERKLASGSCREQESSSSEEEDYEEEEDLNGAYSGVRSLAVSTPSPGQGLPDMRKVLKELVGDLLGVCRALCKRTFMPEMHPAIGMGGTCEAWSVHKKGIARDPAATPGHSFSLQPDTTGQRPARHSSTRVVLECTCSRQKLLGDILCFLHHPDDKLPRDQSSDLLRALCTGSCLDVEKTACRVQMARGFLSQSESRAPQGRARDCPRGKGRGARGSQPWQVPAEALGMCGVPVAPWDAVGWQGWGLEGLSSGVPGPFTGHSPARGWPSGWLGQDGPHAVSSQGLRPLQACRHRCPNAFLGQAVAPIRAVLTDPALAPSHLPHPISYRPPAPGGSCPLPQPRAPSHPALLSPLFSHPLQAMAVAIALVLAVLAAQYGLNHHHQMDVATTERMRPREEYLHQEMTRLLQEIEQYPEEGTVLAALQQWPIWITAGAVAILVLLAEVCFLARERKLASGSCREQESSSSEEEDYEEEEDLNGAYSGVRSLAVSTPSPGQGLPDMHKVLKELVGDLLGVCRALCKRTFMPEMHPAIGMGGTCEAWSVHKKGIARDPSRPPPGTLSACSRTLQGSGQRGTPAPVWCWSARAQGRSCWGIFCAFSTTPTTSCRGIRARTSYAPSAQAPA